MCILESPRKYTADNESQAPSLSEKEIGKKKKKKRERDIKTQSLSSYLGSYDLSFIVSLPVLQFP